MPAFHTIRLDYQSKMPSETHEHVHLRKSYTPWQNEYACRLQPVSRQKTSRRIRGNGRH